MKSDFIREITTLLDKANIVRNAARKNFIARFVIALIKSRNVHFAEIAHHLNDDVKIASNETRIQDFFREVEIDFVAVAKLIINILPRNVKLRVCIDRTEWNFGIREVNILMLLIGFGDLQVLLCWEFLDNRSGNSSSEDRNNLVIRLLSLIEPDRIGLIIADREFVGHKWLKFLKDNNLRFLVRLPKHHQITNLDGRKIQITDLNIALSEPFLLVDCLVDNVWGNVWIMRLSATEWLYLFGNIKPEFMGQLYRKRWSIESCFQNLKGRGFSLNQTQLKSLDKLSKLLALVLLAYCLCYCVGIYIHRKLQPVRSKNHGYKPNSFARIGLTRIRELTRSGRNHWAALWQGLQIGFRWLRFQLSHYQQIILVG